MIWQYFNDPAIAGRLCLALVHSLWIVPVLAATAWLIGRGSVHRSYAAHAVALALSLLALPLTFVFVPGPASPVQQPAEASTVTIESIDGSLTSATDDLKSDAHADVSPSPAVESEAVPVLPSMAGPAAEAASPEVGAWVRWAPWIVGAYALGVVMMLARLGIGLWRAHRLARSGHVVRDGPLVDLLKRLQRQWQLRAAPSLAQVERIVVPKVVGVLRPTILLPASAVTGLTAGELEMILAHELAHVRRRDMWVNLVQRLAEAVLFFNPALWYLSRRVSMLREYCCDELACTVVEQSTEHPRTRYAQALLRVVELAGPEQRQVQVAALAASGRGPSELRRRVARLFGEPLREPVRVTRGGMLAIAGVALAMLVMPFIASPPTAHSQPSETNATEPDDSQPAADDAVAQGEFTFPITVFGKALKSDGKPIAGATIYLASQRPGYKRLAETTTDEEGKYRFDDVPLPIKSAEKMHGHHSGAFEVFGTAEGLALAWRPQKYLYPSRKQVLDISPSRPPEEQKTGYGVEDAIELDLTFREPTRFGGRVVDDQGNPIPNTKLAIRYCDTKWNGFDYNTIGFEGSLNSLNEDSIVPPAVKTRTTDAEGRFEFTGLPAGYRWRIDVRPPEFASRSIYVVTGHDVGNDPSAKVYSDDFDLVFERPKLVTVLVVYGDSGKPAEKVMVSLGSKLASAWTSSDSDGLAQIKVPDGEYTLGLLQRIGTPYLRGEQKVTIDENTRDEVIVAKLEPAAVAEITVVDADTGKPLAGVDVWREDFTSDGTPYRAVHGYRSWEVETRISHYERPRTDEHGKMRVLFEPAAYRIGIGKDAFPEGYEPVEPDGKFVELEAGEPTEVVFEMRDPSRKPPDEEPSNNAEEQEDASADEERRGDVAAVGGVTDTYIAFNSGQALLDLDTGKTNGPLATQSPSDVPEFDLYANWAAAHGETIPILSSQVRKLRQVEARVWDEATPESVAALLAKTAEVAQRSQVVARTQDEYPRTWAIETGQGGQAIVQVIEYRDDIRTFFSGDEGVEGFKLRYKLMRRALEEKPPSDENSDATAPQILGDRFVVCPVTTELQRRLLGGVNSSAANASLCVMVNAAAFGSADVIENNQPDFDDLTKVLGEFANRDNRQVWFRTIDAMEDELAFDERQRRMDVLSEHFKKLGEQAGFANVRTSQTYGASRINGEPFTWDKYINRAREKSSDFGQLEIPFVETGELRVTEVSLFLSHLLVNADCVVDVLHTVRDADGARLQGDLLPAVADAVAKLETEDGGTLLIRLRYSKTAEDELDAWINDIPGRKAYAQSLGYELCNVSQSRIADSEELPAADDPAASQIDKNR